jgi:SAM-dependent methyltransferase
LPDEGNNLLSRLETARAEISQLREQLAASAAEVEARDSALRLLHRSRSWRVTAPLSALTRALHLNSKPGARAQPSAAAFSHTPSITTFPDAPSSTASPNTPGPTASTKIPGLAVSINKDFHGLDEFMAFAKANPIFFDDDIEKNIIRHCQICGIHSIAMGACDPSEVAVIGPESREHLMIRGFNSRQRAALEELYTFLQSRNLSGSDVKVYGHEAITPLALFLRSHFPKYLGTEFAHDEVQKAELFPIPHGDVCHSEFKSSTFDVIVSCEILEHVPSIDEALSESARILVDGGRFIGTMPFFYCRQDSQRFATMEDGKIKQLIEPPIYHGDPMDPDGGVLVFEIPGWDLLDRARRSGFSHAAMRFICEQNKGIIATSLAGELRAKGVFVAIFDK